MWPTTAMARPRVRYSETGTINDQQLVILDELNITYPCEACCNETALCNTGSTCELHWTSDTVHVCVPVQVIYTKLCATHPGMITCPVGQMTVSVFVSCFAASILYTFVLQWNHKPAAAPIL